ncbi:hypothetical protein [Vannielia litorea]|uniref:DUF4189 domain-containing protein n=1 Tax=Vannielia litorea TaxID=1217970 RepID=A0A1N6ILU1_9RHOB|nr:hypothetical protein [Vannielia litorea]SIO32990.1 hypothetical protein SAMN05444002_4052 [Vannielia litorea]
MTKQISLFAAVAAIAALSFSAVSGLVRGEVAVPAGELVGPSPEALAAAYPQAWSMHKAYTEFGTGPQWHGAFAVGSGGAFGAVSGYADRKVTRADALAHCALWAEDCRIVAEILPVAPLPAAAPTLSGPQAQALIGLQRGHGGHRAFAVDARGHWGRAWGYVSAADAEIKALAECRKAQSDGTPALGPDIACKLVWADG